MRTALREHGDRTADEQADAIVSHPGVPVCVPMDDAVSNIVDHLRGRFRGDQPQEDLEVGLSSGVAATKPWVISSAMLFAFEGDTPFARNR